MSENLIEYVVVADAVTVSTGVRLPNNETQVVRLERGETIKAPEGNASVFELLSMGGIVPKSDIKAAMSRVNKMSGEHRPTVVRDVDASPERQFRITAAGVSALMLDGEDPADMVVADVSPLHADNPDLSVPGEGLDGA